MVRLALAFVLCAVSGAPSAQEACFEPIRPDTSYLVDGGYDAHEIRETFRAYFSEVEDYLNCLNYSSARIRQDATAAAQDYNRVLDQHPIQPAEGIEPEQAPRIEMTGNGTLFLDYEAKWLQ